MTKQIRANVDFGLAGVADISNRFQTGNRSDI